MTYIFELNHPKHYYQFKYVMRLIKDDGHSVYVLARDKDVLLNVLKEEDVPYLIFGKHNKNMYSKILGTFAILRHYALIVRRIKPDVIISKASFYGCFAAKLFHLKSVIFPDSEIVKVTNRYVVPLCTGVVTPETFGISYGAKHIRVPGFFENCYLSPSVFQPSNEVVEKYGIKQPYAILRFVGWYANHDVQNGGFSFDEKIKLISLISRYMTVYVSSEKELPIELKPYRLPTPSAQIHSVLSMADLYVGDSQTMATEAALLGTPAIRSNSFVGEKDMTNFRVLEEKYGLLKNICDFNEVMSVVKDYASNSRKNEWKVRQKEYFSQVGDSNALIKDIIEHI